MIPPFDTRGLLPTGDTGFYFPSIEEFTERFVFVEDEETRLSLFEKYSKLCIRCLNTNALVSHYVNGSYTTDKEEPDDVDLLIILDGIKIDDGPDELFEESIEMNDRDKMKEEYSCHTWCILDYPSTREYDEVRKFHDAVKNDVISWWQTNFLDEERTITDPERKGVIILSESEIDKMRSA
jgi:hypothetical protein